MHHESSGRNTFMPPLCLCHKPASFHLHCRKSMSFRQQCHQASAMVKNQAGQGVKPCLAIHVQTGKNAILRAPSWRIRPDSPGLPAAQFVPFIQGPRNCLGQNFSLLESRIVLGLLLEVSSSGPLQISSHPLPPLSQAGDDSQQSSPQHPSQGLFS